MSVTCPRKFGRNATCGAVLEFITVDGHLVERCWACARMARGICRDCPRPVYGAVGKARRCAAHHHLAYNHREKLRMRQPETRRRNLDNMRAWRNANPDRVRANLKAQRLRRKLRQLRAFRAARRAA